jgi:hypothetical protein
MHPATIESVCALQPVDKRWLTTDFGAHRERPKKVGYRRLCNRIVTHWMVSNALF